MDESAWKAFREFLSNRQPPRSLSESTADDAIEFLLTLPSNRINEFVRNLSAATFKEIDGHHKENPFGSARVTNFLRDYDEEKLFEKILTASDVNNLYCEVDGEDAEKYFCLANVHEGTDILLQLEDEKGKLWRFSHVSVSTHAYRLTNGWSHYVKEKQLGAGDSVYFQQHPTDSSRLVIGFRRHSDIDGTALVRYESEITGQHEDQKEDLFEQCLTINNVFGLYKLVITPNEDSCEYFRLATVKTTDKFLRLEDEEGKQWLFSYFKVDQSYILATGWRNYIKEKQLSEGDFVFFQRHLMDSSRLFIGYRRRDNGGPVVAALGQLRLLRHSVAGFEPILVISCGDSQDSEETYFISYIFKDLCVHGFNPLRYDLKRSTSPGSPEMLYSSRVGIMIISMNYACSKECLDGFLSIMDHLKAKDIVLIPVYFDVSLLDVRNQSGSFGEAFVQLKNSLQASEVQKWRKAMIRLTSIKGCQYRKGDEVMLAKNIVRDVCLLLSSETSRNRKGMRSQLKSILFMLNCSQLSAAPQIVGLWGMAGIGKTTIAREIFRTLAERYEVCYFLPDFHLMCQTKGLTRLRDEFVSTIFGEDNVFTDACDTKLSFTRDRFLDKRVLIVLDDVSNARDAEVLVGGFGWFSGGHTIILTSRNRQVLVQCKVKEPYEIPKLSKPESVQLCRQSASERNWKLISELMDYGSGIPLVLRVFGSSLQKKYILNEREHLKRLRQNPPVEIQDAFKRSFNGLDDNEKNIYLDLTCFFKGENKDHVVNILDGCGFLTDIGIYGLVDESLISIVDNRIEMPNIFQDMGRFVVCHEHEEAGKRSRLWDSKDIGDVLKINSGTEAIEGIFFDVSSLTFELSPTIFERMYRLRLLKIHCPAFENDFKICLPQGLSSLPDELRLLYWERYPLGSLPRNFNPKNLVELNMPYSNLTKLWKGTKNLENLKRIILSHSRQLTKLPRLSKANNLEHIDLEGCTGLIKVNSSIIHCQKLTFLSLKDCSHLRIMPATVHLESLEVLNLSGCSELEGLPDLSPNLKELYLAGTAIREMPLSIWGLTRLVTFDLEKRTRLQHLPLEIGNQKAVVTHSTNRPASSMYLSTLEDMSPPYRRYKLKTVIEEVILRLRRLKREKSVSTATNLSQVLHGPASSSVKDSAYPSFWRFHALPERPSQPKCQYYMKTGECKYGNACGFHHPKDRETHVSESVSSMASVAPNLNSPGLSFPLVSSSSSGFVEPSTKKLRIHKNTSSMVSETSHLDPHGVLPSLGTSSFVSDITQASVPRDTIDPKKEEENYGDIWDVREW